MSRMRRILVAAAVIQLSLAANSSLQERTEMSGDQLRGLRGEIISIQEAWGIPGMAVGIIVDEEVILADGFGFRDLEASKPVDSKTLFRIGSCSKPLTALSIGHAFQTGRMAVDKPIRETIADFALEDDWATQRATVTDLLTHQSGLGRYDLLSHGTDFSRADLVLRTGHLPARAGFREGFVYSNLNYALAAHVLEVSTGGTWEEYIREQIFAPLGMQNTCFTIDAMKATRNYALPHQKPLRDLKAPVFELDPEKWDAFNPAGGVISNLDDLLQWLRLCLNNGDPVLMKPYWEAWLVPYVGLSYSSSKIMRTSAYGLGWYIYNYRGHHLVSHSGIASGYCANVSFMPFEGIAVVVLTNLKNHSAHDVIPRVIYDRLLGLERYDHQGEYLRVWDDLASGILKRDEEIMGERRAGTDPSFDLGEYCGRYENSAYGTLTISRDSHMPGREGVDAALKAGGESGNAAAQQRHSVSDGDQARLVAILNHQVTLPLEHYHDDVWFCRDSVRIEFDMLGFEFRVDENGKVGEVILLEEMQNELGVFGRTAN